MQKTFRQISFNLDNEPWKIPYWEIDSGRPGPCLLVSAALHGNEINGAESIVRWVNELPSTLKKGSVLALPLANLPAARLGRQVECPEYRKQQVWPGAADGNRKEQLYAALHDAVVGRATHLIDLHSYEEYMAAETLTFEDDPVGIELGLAAALPFTRIIAVPPGGPEKVPPPPGGKVWPCTLRKMMNESGRAAVTLELSGQFRLFPEQVKLGVECLRRMAAYLEMTDQVAAPPPETTRIYAPRDNDRKVLITAPDYGLLISAGKKPGDFVEKGEVIAEWLPEETLEIEPLKAPINGRLCALGVHYPKAPASAGKDNNTGQEGRTPVVERPVAYPYAAPGAVLAGVFPDQTTP